MFTLPASSEGRGVSETRRNRSYHLLPDGAQTSRTLKTQPPEGRASLDTTKGATTPRGGGRAEEIPLPPPNPSRLPFDAAQGPARPACPELVAGSSSR